MPFLYTILRSTGYNWIEYKLSEVSFRLHEVFKVPHRLNCPYAVYTYLPDQISFRLLNAYEQSDMTIYKISNNEKAELKSVQSSFDNRQFIMAFPS